jgi:hypothetical protein
VNVPGEKMKQLVKMRKHAADMVTMAFNEPLLSKIKSCNGMHRKWSRSESSGSKGTPCIVLKLGKEKAEQDDGEEKRTGSIKIDHVAAPMAKSQNGAMRNDAPSSTAAAKKPTAAERKDLAPSAATMNPKSSRNEAEIRYTGTSSLCKGWWTSRVDVYVNECKARRKVYLGRFDDQEAAARLYDSALFYLNGAQAKLNFPRDKPRPLSNELKAKIDAAKIQCGARRKDNEEEEDEEPQKEIPKSKRQRSSPAIDGPPAAAAFAHTSAGLDAQGKGPANAVVISPQTDLSTPLHAPVATLTVVAPPSDHLSMDMLLKETSDLEQKWKQVLTKEADTDWGREGEEGQRKKRALEQCQEVIERISRISKKLHS